MSFKPLMAAICLCALGGCVSVTYTTQNGTTGAPHAWPASAHCPTPAAAAANAAAMRDLINQQRRQAGIAPVAMSAAATTAAQAYACEIAARRDISHIGSDGSNAGDRLARVGLSFSYVEENSAEGYTTVDKTFAAWMASAGHRRNILNAEVTQMGLGQAEGPYPTWVLDLFTPD